MGDIRVLAGRAGELCIQSNCKGADSGTSICLTQQPLGDWGVPHSLKCACFDSGCPESHVPVPLSAEDRALFQVTQVEEGVVHVAGPPATCVNIALHNLGLEDVDLVISGPNVGHNAGW